MSEPSPPSWQAPLLAWAHVLAHHMGGGGDGVEGGVSGGGKDGGDGGGGDGEGGESDGDGGGGGQQYSRIMV